MVAGVIFALWSKTKLVLACCQAARVGPVTINESTGLVGPNSISELAEPAQPIPPKPII